MLFAVFSRTATDRTESVEGQLHTESALFVSNADLQFIGAATVIFREKQTQRPGFKTYCDAKKKKFRSRCSFIKTDRFRLVLNTMALYISGNLSKRNQIFTRSRPILTALSIIMKPYGRMLPELLLCGTQHKNSIMMRKWEELTL